MTIVSIAILLLLMVNSILSIYILKQLSELKELKKLRGDLYEMELRLSSTLGKLTQAQSKINQGFVECLKVLSKCTSDIQSKLNGIRKTVIETNKYVIDYTKLVNTIIEYHHSETECLEEHMKLTIRTMSDVLNAVSICD